MALMPRVCGASVSADKVNKFELPAFAHVPGMNERPQEGFLDHVIVLADDVTKSETAYQNICWLFGIRLFNAQFYWEAHEVWEVVWLNAPPNSLEKRYVQSVIHLTNAALKQKMARPGAVKRLAKLALDCISVIDHDQSTIIMGLAFKDIEDAANLLLEPRTPLSKPLRLLPKYEI